MAIGIGVNDKGQYVYHGDTFEIVMTRYSDPQRLNLARNAARYLGKKDIDNIRRPLSIIRRYDVPEIFRGEHVEFEFHNVSKEVYDHIVTYTTRNMRVAGGNRALTSDDFTMPSDKVKNEWVVRQKIGDSMQNYKDLLDAGETPQVARSAMPVNAKMNIFVYQFNFLTLGQSTFAQRIWEHGAQGNTVKVVQGMYELCIAMDKELWDTFYKYYGTPMMNWREVHSKLEKKGLTMHQLAQLIFEERENYNPDETVVDYLIRKFGERKSMW